MSLPSLTVVLVTQNAQNRIPRLLETLAKQILVAELEVFIVYIAPAKPAPVSPDGLRVIPIHQSDIRNIGQARAKAVRRAHSPWVAFLEDHTIPNPSWAEAVCFSHNPGLLFRRHASRMSGRTARTDLSPV
jgi:glycosyltransferase involved in cell wall biosynthesis